MAPKSVDWPGSHSISSRNRGGVVLVTLTTFFFLLILFLSYTPQTTSNHFLYGAIDWEVDYSNDVEVTFIMGWRLKWFINQKELTTLPNLESYVGKKTKVGLITIVGEPNPTPASDTTTSYSSKLPRTLEVTIDAAYKDELVSNDSWYFGTARRYLYPYATSTKGISNANRSASRHVLYFTRCCRATYIEDLEGDGGDSNGITVWIDKSKRRYSLQSRAFPRQYQELKVALKDWYLPAVNRDDVWSSSAAMVFLSKSGTATLTTGGGDSGMNYSHKHYTRRTRPAGWIVSSYPSQDPTPYAPRGSGTALEGDALKVVTNGQVTWTPDPVGEPRYLKESCQSLYDNNASSSHFCAYAVSFTVEDRFFTGENTATTTGVTGTRIGVMTDFLFVVKKKCEEDKEACPPTLIGVSQIVLIPAVPQTIRYTARGNQATQNVTIQNDPPSLGIFLGPNKWNLNTNTASNEPAYRDITFDSDIDGPKGGTICLKAAATVNSGTPLLSLGIFCPRYTVVRADYLFLTGTKRTFTSNEIKSNQELSITVEKDLDEVTRKPVVSGDDEVIFNHWFTAQTNVLVDTITMTRHYNTGLDKYALNAAGAPHIPRIFSSLRPFWSSTQPKAYQTFEYHTTFDLLDLETLRFGVTGGELFVFIDGKLVVDIRHLDPLPVPATELTQHEGNRQPTPRIQDYLDRGSTAWSKSYTSEEIRSTIKKTQLPTSNADSFPIDIFYTQRSLQTNGFFIEMANSTACSPIAVLLAPKYKAIAKAAQVFDFTPGTWNNEYVQMTSTFSTIDSTKGLILLPRTQKSTSAAAWTKDRLKVLSGFEAKFSFIINPWDGKADQWGSAATSTNPQSDGGSGLAFVIQPASSTARGADGQGLGYSGLSHAIAIEFDSKYDQGVDLSQYSSHQHISVHRPNANNITTSIESIDSWPVGAGVVANLTRLPFGFDNGTLHDITITMIPTISNWWLYVYVNENIRPLYTASFTNDEMKEWFPNGAYLGITTSNTNTQFSTITIPSFNAVVIPPLAEFSKPTSFSLESEAGSTLGMTIQLRDACNTPLSVSGEGNKLFGRFVHKWSSSPLSSPISSQLPNTPYDIIPATVTDDGEGKYTFSAKPLRAGEYYLFVYFREVGMVQGQGNPLGLSPFPLDSEGNLIGPGLYQNLDLAYQARVKPGSVSTARSSYLFGEMPRALDNTNDEDFFTEIDTAGVACYPSSPTGSLISKKLGRVFTTADAYDEWLDAAPESWGYIACVNKGPYTSEIATIIKSANSNTALTPTPSPPSDWIESLTKTTPEVSATWVLVRTDGEWEIAQNLDPNPLLPTPCFSWSDRAAISSKCVFSSMSVILESAPALWTNNVVNGRGMILLHPHQLIRPSMFESEHFLYLRDLYGNPVDLPNISLVHSAIPQLDVIGLDSSPIEPHSPFFRLTLTTQTPGNHLLNIYDAFNDPIGQSGLLTVSAGAAHHETSTASGVTIGGSVDSPMEFTIKLFDLSNYHITEQQGKAEVTAIEWVHSETNNVAMRWEQDPVLVGDTSPVEGNIRSFWDSGEGLTQQYYIKYTPTFAGTYYVKIYINSVCDGDDVEEPWVGDCRRNPRYELVSTKNQILALTPGPSSQLSQVQLIGHSNAIDDITDDYIYQAGEQYTFIITSVDKYGNQRYTYDMQATFNLQLLNTPQGSNVGTTNLKNLIVLPDTFNGDKVTFTSNGGGSYSLAVVFKKSGPVFISIDLTTTVSGLSSGVIKTGSNKDAYSSHQVIPGPLAFESIFRMVTSVDPFVIATTKPGYIATDQGTDNVFFAIEPLDQFSNKITPNLSISSELSVQYVTNGNVYFSNFVFTAINIDETNVYFSFHTNVAGPYTITPSLSSTSAPLSFPSGQYDHKTFDIGAAMPFPPVMDSFVTWPSTLSQGTDLTATFTEYDKYSNQRQDPSLVVPYTLFSLQNAPTACVEGVDMGLGAVCTAGVRPNQNCPVATRSSGQWTLFITPSNISHRPVGCSTHHDICSNPVCRMSLQMAATENRETNGFVAAVRYFEQKPTGITDITSPNVKNFVSTFDFETDRPNDITMDINENPDATSADRYMLVYVIETLSFEPSVSRSLSLEASDTNSRFSMVRSSSLPCDSSLVSFCDQFTSENPDTIPLLYIFEVRLNIVPIDNKNYNFIIKYGSRSITNTASGTLLPYTITIVPGLISPATSQWTTTTNSLITTAGENFSISFIANDLSGNTIKTDVDYARSLPPSSSFAIYSFTPTNPAGNTYAVPVECSFDENQGIEVTCITVIHQDNNGKSTKFQIEKLEAFYLRLSTTQPPNVNTLETFIARSLRTVSVVPGLLDLTQSVLSLSPTGSATFEVRDPPTTNTDLIFYLTARDSYGNSVTVSADSEQLVQEVTLSYGGVIITKNDFVTPEKVWVNLSRNIYTATVRLKEASRSGKNIFAVIEDNYTDRNRIIRVRTQEPYALSSSTTLSPSISDTLFPSKLFNIITEDNIRDASNFQTQATFQGITIDTLNKKFTMTIQDKTGLDFIYNLAVSSNDYPNDNSIISAEVQLVATGPGAAPSILPVNINQLHANDNIAASPALDGKFILTLPTMTTGGSYHLRIYSQRQVIARYQFDVGPGKPKMDYTTFLTRSSTFVTGGEGFFTFQLFDRKYNIIPHDIVKKPSNDINNIDIGTDDLDNGTGTVIASFHHNGVDCNPDIHDFTPYDSTRNLFYALDPVSNRFRFNSISFDQTSFTYTVKFVPSPRGSYTFNLTYVDKTNDEIIIPSPEQVFSCNYMAPLVFTVDTGIPVASKSYFTVSPGTRSVMPTVNSGYAGQSYIVDVYFLDLDGNQSKQSTDILLFWDDHNGDTINPSEDLYINPDQLGGLFDENGDVLVQKWDETNLLSFTSTDLTQLIGYGQHRFTFKPRVANAPDGFFNFKLIMKDYDGVWRTLSGLNPNFDPESPNIPQNTPLITHFQVLHGVPAQILPANLPSTILAGSPYQFQVSALDAYGNLVTTDKLSSLKITVTRVGSSMKQPIIIIEGLQWTLQPSQITTSAAGVSSISFTPTWEGEYSILITMMSKDGTVSLASQPIPDLTQLNLYPPITVIHATCAGQYLAINPMAAIEDIPVQLCQSTGNCVRNVADCPNPRDQIQCSLGQFINENSICEDLPLVPTPEEDPEYVPVATDYKKCPNNTYIPATQTCPQIPSCPSGTSKCPNSSHCRGSTSLCPSEGVCAPGLMICPNGISCATTLSFCPSIPQSIIDSCEGRTLCPSGICVNSDAECPTPPTCAVGEVYCLTDGSCRRDRSLCPTIPIQQTPTPSKCQQQFGPNGVLCADGRMCAARWGDCPSAITCPSGTALCSIDNSCQITSCPSLPGTVSPSNPIFPDDSSPLCAVTEVRCPNGACEQNLKLCGSKPTCPSSEPILCSDLNCKSSLALCNQPTTCSSRGLLQCIATGACVDDLKYCSVPKSCGGNENGNSNNNNNNNNNNSNNNNNNNNKTVLCPTGECASSITTCPIPLECPPSLPYLCSSGNCRANVNDCPTQIGCPVTSPFRCDDNSCALSIDLCKSTIEIIDPTTGLPSRDETTSKCPESLIKCPTGECSAAALTCPTHVTCPEGTSRCPNGQCRSKCPLDPITTTPTDLPTCGLNNLITCPISGSGYVCSESVGACPQGITCPLSQPVKCAFDSTCAISLSDCPQAPSAEQPATKTPCFDGSWIAGSPSDCPTAVTCPPNIPIKCSDSSCRETIDECPIPQPCSSPDTPYRCTSGQCVAAPWDCGPVLDGGIICPSTTPIKCPPYQALTKCVSNIKQCQSYRDPDGSKPVEGGDPTANVPLDPYLSPCPAGFTYCRDGSCQESPSSCPMKVCSVGFPVLCDDGSCAQGREKCTNMVTGCPHNTPNRCPGSGKCVKHIMECPANPCSAPAQPCIDGTCRETCSLAANGCAVSQFRCNDGTCVNEIAHCSSQSNVQSANSCPPAMPYRCGNGFCVEKESQCVMLSTSGLNNCPVLCADGSCRDSTELCPLIKPCGPDKVRCGDGSCRSTPDCPNYNSCPLGQVRCKQSDYPLFTILDGLCAEQGKCYSLNGCPLSNGLEQHRCVQNGRCVSDSSQCLMNLPTTNGCDSGTPHKCWDGQCVLSSSHCPQTNGCPSDKPTRCPSGDCIAAGTECSTVQLSTCPANKVTCADGSCVDKFSQCKTSFNCPVDKPIRCYNGDCKQYSSKYRSPVYGLTNEQINAWTCPPVVSCPSTAYTMCASFKCVLSPSLCPSTSYPCGEDEFMCTDGTCRPDTKWCGYDQKLDTNGDPVLDPTTNAPIWSPSSSKPAQCPYTLPIMCPLSGQCVADITSCNNNADPSTTLLTGSSSSPTKNPNQEFQVQCFDGTWVDSYSQCRSIGSAINKEVNNTDGGSATTGLTPQCVDFCPNGACITSTQNPKLTCSLIPSCLPGLLRCYDGSCRLDCDDVAVPDCGEQLGQGYDPVVHVLNIDGICRDREQSIGHLGCPSNPQQRFQCHNRECARDEEDCSVVAEITNAEENAKEKLHYSPYAIKNRLDEEAERLRKAQRSVSFKPTSLQNVPNSIIASFVQLDSGSTTNGGNKDGNDSTGLSRSCTKNCVASSPVLSTSILYSPLLSTQSYNVAALATGATIQLYSGLQVRHEGDLGFNIHPVGQNLYQNATNKLTFSRIDDFDGIEALTAAQTVLSPVFSCSVGDGIVEPFNIGVKFSSLIDRSQTPTPQPQDICLARLRRFPQHNYSVWMCEFDEEQRRSGDLQYSTRQSADQPLRQAISFISRCSDTDFETKQNPTDGNDAAMNINMASLSDEDVAMVLLQQGTNDSMELLQDEDVIVQQKVPAVYAFIHSPLSSGQVYLPAKDTFWKDNVIWLLFVIIGGLFLIFALAYAILRLSRYSSKTDKIKDEIENTEKEVLEMEQFGGDKRRDGEVGYVNNPLAVSLAQQNNMKDMDEEAMARKQAKLQQQQEDQQERQEVISSLEAENEAALQHLEVLRKKASRSPKTE